MADFADRKILYTGAAGGLGLPGVVALLERGARVVVLDRDPEKIEQLRESTRGSDERLLIKVVDLADEAKVRAAVSEAIGEVGGIDTLINNAAIYPSKPFDQFSLEEYKLVQKINVESAFICTQLVLPFMKSINFGRIVNITSITFSGGWENLSAYVASKGTLLGLARSWAREYGAFGITANCLAPGAFPTDAEKIHPNQEQYTKFIFDHQSVKRRGTPQDIVNALLFLIAKESGFITGQSLNVDGGWVME
jgi:NAD(P)-dependent dehydrogenase (short-subunit alcohol dehydrogenase family)